MIHHNSIGSDWWIGAVQTKQCGDGETLWGIVDEFGEVVSQTRRSLNALSLRGNVSGQRFLAIL